MDRYTIFNIKDNKEIKYGRNIGIAYLNTATGKLMFAKETVENIRKSSINGKFIFDTNICLRPMIDASGLSIVDMNTSEEFFKALEKKANTNSGKMLINFFNMGKDIVVIDNDSIMLSPGIIDLFDINKEHPEKSKIDQEYELIVGYFVRDYKDSEYREYYVINPTDSFATYQERYKSIMQSENIVIGE